MALSSILQTTQSTAYISMAISQVRNSKTLAAAHQTVQRSGIQLEYRLTIGQLASICRPVTLLLLLSTTQQLPVEQRCCSAARRLVLAAQSSSAGEMKSNAVLYKLCLSVTESRRCATCLLSQLRTQSEGCCCMTPTAQGHLWSQLLAKFQDV
jgi:hypothetical protein